MKKKLLSVLKWLSLIIYSIGMLQFLVSTIDAFSYAQYSKFSAVCVVFTIYGILIFYATRPHRKSEWEDLYYRVLDVVSTLNAVNDHFPYYDIEPYVISCLNEYRDCIGGVKQHKYECQNGHVYYSSPSNPILFAFVCMGQYAVYSGNDKLRSYCDEHILDAHRSYIR